MPPKQNTSVRSLRKHGAETKTIRNQAEQPQRRIIVRIATRTIRTNREAASAYDPLVPHKSGRTNHIQAYSRNQLRSALKLALKALNPQTTQAARRTVLLTVTQTIMAVSRKMFMNQLSRNALDSRWPHTRQFSKACRCPNIKSIRM